MAVQLTKTIIGNRILRLIQTFGIMAGVDGTLTPKLLTVNDAGRLLVSTGSETASLPDYDSTTVDYYSSTNNIHHVYYKTGGINGTVVAVRTITYAGAGVADNDILTGSALVVV